MDKPLCSKCGNHHWGFWSCDRGRPVEMIHRLPEGVRLFGDRMDNYERQGNVLYLKPKPPEAA